MSCPELNYMQVGLDVSATLQQ